MKLKKIFLLLLISLSSPFIFAQQSYKVSVTGSGKPVLFFPGIGCPGEVWEETVSELSKTYECHVFTFAGFGEVPPVGTPWLSRIKEEILEYADSNNLVAPTLIGHSLGGTLSLWMATTDTTLFEQVIVVDALPATAALMIPNYQGQELKYDSPQNKMMVEMDQKSFEELTSRNSSFLSLNKEKHSQITKWITEADRKTYVYGYTEMLNLDLRDQIAQIKTLVTVIAATFPDKATIQKNYLDQYRKLPSTEFIYAENSAHFIMFDQRDWFIEQLKKLLEKGE
ncbi:alpha/beta hydrolase [Algoriphagus lacus]|uniref:Alpha/beta hydrolase n=1 Tax=Algoriphagus lacus TaxID=2056311 RepID=A0A418PNC3_9BACT|nr:alpha/beta hydrolase [Algoriphagus lacus]RIW13385.1 alpha/beta hydrolase [Algoriphagus lacus]